MFSIPNSYNSFLLWFYGVFLHVAFLGSGVHLWVVILLFLFVRFQEMLKIYHIFFYLQTINPKIGFILKKKFRLSEKGPQLTEQSKWPHVARIGILQLNWFFRKSIAWPMFYQCCRFLFEWKLKVKQSQLPNWFGSCWLWMWTLFRLERNGKLIILALPRYMKTFYELRFEKIILWLFVRSFYIRNEIDFSTY